MSNFIFKQKTSFVGQNPTPARSQSGIIPSFSNATFEEAKLLKLLVLETFKIFPCTIKTNHNHKQCQFYHYPRDRKRKGEGYSADLCEYVEMNKICPYGDKCPKSHSGVEQLYRKEKYKMKFCSHYPSDIQNCEYGEYCSFAHSEEELLIDLLHRLEKNEDFFIFKFKTVMCPFNSIPHDKAQCVYAHNWQDFRRKPNTINYESVPCSFWKPNDFLTIYNLGCPNGFNCHKCHGWKEYDYHPLIYKTKLCPNGNKCHRTFECANFHSEKDIRVIDQKIQMGAFRYSSKNVLAENSQKMHINITHEKQDNRLEIAKRMSSLCWVPENEIISPYQSNEKCDTRNTFASSLGSFKNLENNRQDDMKKMTYSVNFNTAKNENKVNDFNEFDQISMSLNEIYLGDNIDDENDQLKKIVENE